MKTHSPNIQISNLFFVAPLLIAFQQNILWYVPIISLVTIFSFLYHFAPSVHLFELLDRVFAIALIASNLFLCVTGNHHVSSLVLVALLIPVSFFFLYRKGNYTYNHSMWHLVSAYICTFSILSYLL